MCDLCSFVTTTQSDLTAHVEARHEKPEKKFSCNQCNFSAARKATLKQHLDTVHGVKKKFTCETCGYKCDRKTRLNKHISVCILNLNNFFTNFF